MKIDMVTLNQITKVFVQGNIITRVLDGITASFARGKTYALMGVSGAGKSTLLHIIAALDTPTSGTVSYDGRILGAMSEVERQKLLNNVVGLAFQQPYLLKELSVVENVMLPRLIAGDTWAHARTKAAALLKHVGLEGKQSTIPATLSGGEQQRVALARALVNEPSFLLIDEFTANLDSATADAIIALLLDCAAKWHMGIIATTHDMRVAQRLGSILTLRDGVLQP